MLGVVILAGGRASRFPGKLEIEFRGEPLILRVYRNVRDAGPVYVASNRTFAPAIDAALDCPVIVDRFEGAGPLAALHGALGQVAQERVFVAGGDMPFVHAGVAAQLLAHLGDGMQAVAATDKAGHIQPLCAVYVRTALIEAAARALEAGNGAVKAALELLRYKSVRIMDDRVLAGVNTPEDFVAVRTFDLGIRPGT